MIIYLKGDATNPKRTGPKIICHVCNDIGKWGSGFVLAISKKWKEPETKYKKWYKSQEDFKLGEVQFVEVSNNLWVANMIAQHNIWNDNLGRPPIRYDSLRKCLLRVAGYASYWSASVHMPRIGCGLAGGVWEEIEPIIIEELKNIDVYVYDWSPK